MLVKITESQRRTIFNLLISAELNCYDNREKGDTLKYIKRIERLQIKFQGK